MLTQNAGLWSIEAIGRMVLAAILLVSVSVLAADINETKTFDIKPQSMDRALIDFSKQAGFQIVADSADVALFQTRGVTGKRAVAAALDELLSGTGLSYRVIGTDVITIEKSERKVGVPGAASGAGATIAEVQGQSRSERVAASQPQDQSAGARDPNEATDLKDRTGRTRVPDQRESKAQQIEKIVVTGTNIRGARNNTAPIIVLDRDYIESTGFSTPVQLIESLPQNFALASQSGVVTPGVTANNAQGSAINLRGIGEGATLVLLNGRRIAPGGFGGSAADISALPLSAIERVEVLPDGASAIYGADAVGGVVNFVLRTDFEGAETRARTGSASGGIHENRVNQVVGHAWDSGNAVVALDYYKRDLLPASKRDFVPSTSTIGSLLPRDENTSAMFSGRQRVMESITLFADALYAKRDTFNQGGRTIFHEQNASHDKQLTTTAGLDWEVGRDWQIEAVGSYAEDTLGIAATNDNQPYFGGGVLIDSLFTIRSGTVKADGPLFSLPGGSVRAAVGAETRSESYRIVNRAFSGGVNIDVHPRQNVHSAFGEVTIPVIGPSNAFEGARRVDLSLAGRFDDYSNFGSSFDPKGGISWRPVDGLLFRGSYGTSYKAPRLFDYNTSGNVAVALTDGDPASPEGVSHQLQVYGIDAGNLSAQKSKNLSIGAEFSPNAIGGLKLAINYYQIDYRDEIATPPLSASTILGSPNSFGGLIIRNPTVAQINQYVAVGRLGNGFIAFNPDFSPDNNFDPTSIAAIVDFRRRNLSDTKTNGLDVSAQYDFRVSQSEIHVGLDGTYVFKRRQRLTAASEPFDTVGTIYNPPHLRLRGSAGWRRQGWAANVFVNYTGSYTDNRVATALLPVSSYATFDARLAFDFTAQGQGRILSGVIVSLSAQNLFDKKPPRIAIVDSFRDMGFDPTNANPMGRLVALEVVKKW